MHYARITEQGARVAPYIDHTLLKAEAIAGNVEAVCHEAEHYGFAAVCVNPSMVPVVEPLLHDSGVKVCTVIGFPLGATTTAAKQFESAEAVQNGASELDMVIAVGRLKGGDSAYVLDDIRAVVKAAQGHTVKVILETSLLSDPEKTQACRLAVDAGADFVKTSTGFGGGGATVEDISLMRTAVGPDFGVKASGGIRSLDDALRMLDSGATRIGASDSVAIVT